MASTIPPIPSYACIAIRQKMAGNVNIIAASGLCCHHGDTDDVFLVGGLIQTGETLMASAIRHCRHIINFRFSQNNHLYKANVINRFIYTSLLKYQFMSLSLFSTISKVWLDITFQH
jgi:hypothetical protein